MSDIRTKPVTPEYEDSWDRVFGEKLAYKKYGGELSVSIKELTTLEDVMEDIKMMILGASGIRPFSLSEGQKCPTQATSTSTSSTNR